MKTLKFILITLATSLLFVTGCGEKEITNPFDEGCPKELFTPSDFKAAMEGNTVKLTWAQENMQINGYVVNRSENDGTMAEVARIDKATKTWTDTKVAGGTKYNYQLYAYAGANLSNALTATITTPAMGATVTTATAATNVTATSAVLGGDVTSDGGAPVTERGVCYGTSPNPTTSNGKQTMGSGKGIFSGTVSGLTGNTKYYVRAYAINTYGTVYGAEINFTTNQLSVSTVTTSEAITITSVSAVLGGNVTNDGGATVTERGVCYSTSQNPTITNSKLAMGNGTGVFSNTVTGLTVGTTYYARSYATNSQGTAYGAQVTFTTTPVSTATVTTSSATTVTAISAVLGGNVSNDGGATVTERGVCYSTSQNPTTSNSKLAIGTGTGTFTNTVTGLIEGTTYYVRAYAINSQGTAYGTQINFTTSQHSLATVTTADATNITGTTVVLGGNVTNDGNATVTERGVCYAITENPTTGNTKLAIGNGTGAFSSTASGLTGNTTYFARAYAINSKGTAYGNQITFKTPIALSLATVTTSDAKNVAVNSANLAGNVTNDGGATVTERGFCYSFTVSNPTTSDPKVIVGNGVGPFSATLTNLVSKKVYYVRAYAINSVGTAYGNGVNFTTLEFISVPTLTTMAANNITQTAATSGGNITADGGAAVTARGICYSTNQNPTLTDNFTSDGNGIGQYVSQMTGLLPGTTYYIRAYATNSSGTAYGTQITCPTLKSIPTLTTKSITDVSAMGCVTGGIITFSGGGTISAKGICWGEAANPTLTDNVISSGTGAAPFNSSIVGAVPGTTYYVRSYATNEIGTAYGDQKSFTTLSNVTYYGFENGMLPTGWSGQWTVTNTKAFEGSYSLRSLAGVVNQTTLTATLTNAGQISFFYYMSNSGSIDFYIDDIKVGSFPTSVYWSQALFDISAGKHVFKWVFNPGGGAQGHIDYIIFPK